MSQKQANNGFLIVASKKKPFYISALHLIESIKDYCPDANVCFVVDQSISDDRVSVADHVLYTEKEGDYRAKLWGMWKSPYDKTLYLDADMECVHEDAISIFDQLQDNDLMFTELNKDRDIAFKNRYFPAGQFDWNGGVCLYNSSSDLVTNFMHRWWELFTLQNSDQWWPTDPQTGNWDEVSYGDRNVNKWWDQFTLWYLLNKEKEWADLKVNVLQDDLRWNYYTSYGKVGVPLQGLEPVFVHYSSKLKKDFFEYYETIS